MAENRIHTMSMADMVFAIYVKVNANWHTSSFSTTALILLLIGLTRTWMLLLETAHWGCFRVQRLTL